MCNDMFRALRADEIECRIGRAMEKGVSLLLYKDARCDQNILDETVGVMGWQRTHSRDNANCTVSLWDKEKQQWISKEDTGTESYTEKEKGLASDSFKRACFNWGIGRELYTAPFIWIKAEDCKKLAQENGRWVCKDDFVVSNIEIQNKRILSIAINNKTSGKVVFRYNEPVYGAKLEDDLTKGNEHFGKTFTFNRDDAIAELQTLLTMDEIRATCQQKRVALMSDLEDVTLMAMLNKARRRNAG